MRIAAAVVALAVPALAAGQGDARFELYNGCAPMSVVVDVSRAEGLVFEELAHDAARSVLRRAGLYDSEAPAALQLTVAATTGRDRSTVAYAYAARYRKPMRDPASGLTGMAVTWIGGGVNLRYDGAFPAGSWILGDMVAGVEGFLRQYLSVNGAACD